jgi:hypothetical protein
MAWRRGGVLIINDDEGVLGVVNHENDVLVESGTLRFTPALIAIFQVVESGSSVFSELSLSEDVDEPDSWRAGHTCLFSVTTDHRVIHPIGIDVCCRQLQTFDSWSCMISIAMTM